MGRPTNAERAARAAAAAAAPPPAATEAVHVDEGGGAGQRPGPKRSAAPPTVMSTGIAPAVSANSDPSVGIGQPSAKDINEMKWQAKQTQLRDDVLKIAAEQNKGRNMSPQLFGTRLEADEGEVGGEEAGSDDGEGQNTKPAESKPKSSNEELAAIAAKDRENRELRRKLKAIENTPKAADREAKLKELMKTNPRGVFEYLGGDFSSLAETYLANKQGEAVKFDESAPNAKREPTEAEKELAEERRKRQELERRVAQRGLSETVEKMVKDTKAKDGSLRWGNVARIGGEDGDGAPRALSNAQAFAAGLIDENGTRLETPRRMKKFSDADAKGVLEHFLDRENTRLARVSKKLGAASQRPEPRKVSQTRPGPKTLSYDPANPLDPNNPRNRKDWRTIGEEVRARHFGPR